MVGIVGGATFGVAKLANLVGVRVIGNNGYSDWGTVLSALSW